MKHKTEFGVFDHPRRHAPARPIETGFREDASVMFPILEGLVAVVFLVQGFAKLFGSPLDLSHVF